MRIILAMIFMLVVVAGGANAQTQATLTAVNMHAAHVSAMNHRDMNPMDGHCGTKSHQPGQHCLCLSCVPVVMQPVALPDKTQLAPVYDSPVVAAMTDLITGPQPPPPRV
jgi:hypothetical protein